MRREMDISIACGPSLMIVLVHTSPIAKAVNLRSKQHPVRTTDAHERTTHPTQ